MGIRIYRSLSEIQAHMQGKDAGKQVVVQKYIEKPLLLTGRKFDIRTLVLCDPKMHVYVYDESYLRTSSYQYNDSDIQNRSIHLTNYAVQKKEESAGQMEEGNNLSMEEFTAAVRAEHPEKSDFDARVDVMKRCFEIVTMTFQAVNGKLNPYKEKHTFELYGFDFMVDANFNVWLIEVNTNPYLGCSSSLLRGIFTGMLEGAVQICVDPYFPAPPGASPVETVEGADKWIKVLPQLQKHK